MPKVELPPPRPRYPENPRRRRIFHVVLAAGLTLYSLLWVWTTVDALRRGDRPRLTARITEPALSADAPPTAAFLIDAVMRSLASGMVAEAGGESGAVRVIIAEPGDTTLLLPDSLPADVDVGFLPTRDTLTATSASVDTSAAPSSPGIWNVVVSARNAIRSVPNLRVISLVPLARKRGGRIGDYQIGNWPWEDGGTPRSPAYAPPVGLVQVDRGDVDVPVSDHFTLGDFLTKGQADVWPKYVALSPRLLDKLELTIQELERMGHPVENVGAISGFRTPSYNEGGGNTSGRGALSRHMYGDAMDFFVDNDRDFRMDDLDGSGRADVGDARIMAEAAERVERAHPSLIGGIGIYPPTGAHAGFIHIDTRGYRARW